MTPRSTRLTLLLVTVVAGIAAGRIAGGAGERIVADPAIDRGPAALLALGAVEGREIDFNKLAARLPYRREGYSMKELRDVARSFGLKLAGEYVGKHAGLIDRPMLAFIKDKDAKIEHFLVVRPVGHTGSLVQLIDSNGPPRVIEKSELVASSQWTGIVLVPARTNWAVVGGSGLLAGSGLLGLSLLIARRGRRRPTGAA